LLRWLPSIRRPPQGSKWRKGFFSKTGRVVGEDKGECGNDEGHPEVTQSVGHRAKRSRILVVLMIFYVILHLLPKTQVVVIANDDLPDPLLTRPAGGPIGSSAPVSKEPRTTGQSGGQSSRNSCFALRPGKSSTRKGC